LTKATINGGGSRGSTIQAMPDQHNHSLDDPRPVARLFTDKAEILTPAGWHQLPLAGPSELNRISLKLNEHLDQLGIPFDVAVKTIGTASNRRAWFELRTAATNVRQATTWPAALLQTAE
jgi:hypothetical protein